MTTTAPSAPPPASEPALRLAVVSDIHGNLAALEAVAADIGRHGADRVVNLGDSLSGPLWPLETARYLMAQGWLSLAGNHERQLLDPHPRQPRGPSDEYARSCLTARELGWLESLPPTARPAPGVLLCHGTPSSDVAYWLETVDSDGSVRAASPQEIETRLAGEAAPLIACGHTHIARTALTQRGQLVVNPGSVGLPAYDDIHPVPHAVETGSPDARYAIVEKTCDGAWTARLLSIPYDHPSAARQARRQGRPEWAHALMTGRMP